MANCERTGGVMNDISNCPDLPARNVVRFNHDAEVKKAPVKKPASEGQPSVTPDYTIDANGWLVVNGKPLRPTRFTRSGEYKLSTGFVYSGGWPVRKEF